jgi:hypothetical protein
MLNKRALAKFGWTPALIDSVLGAPDQRVSHVHGFRRWSECLYSQARIDSGMNDPRFQKAIARRKRHAAALEKERNEIPAQYATWREALAPACEGLIALNRYAKHPRCSEPDKCVIYRLKNAMIRLLYERGYCSLAWLHRLVLPEQKYRERNGTGEDCAHCDGSGVWREARELEFWCFRFVVAGRAYIWHQPRASVDYVVHEDLPPQDWAGLVRLMPGLVRKEKLVLIEELIEWVLGSALSESDELPGVGSVTESSEFNLFSA